MFIPVHGKVVWEIQRHSSLIYSWAWAEKAITQAAFFCFINRQQTLLLKKTEPKHRAMIKNWKEASPRRGGICNCNCSKKCGKIQFKHWFCHTKSTLNQRSFFSESTPVPELNASPVRVPHALKLQTAHVRCNQRLMYWVWSKERYPLPE